MKILLHIAFCLLMIGDRVTVTPYAVSCSPLSVADESIPYQDGKRHTEHKPDQEVITEV
jgi:hypothetical protein